MPFLYLQISKAHANELKQAKLGKQMAWTNHPSRFPSAIHFVATGAREEKHTRKSTSSFAAAHPVNQPLSFSCSRIRTGIC